LAAGAVVVPVPVVVFAGGELVAPELVVLLSARALPVELPTPGVALVPLGQELSGLDWALGCLVGIGGSSSGKALPCARAGAAKNPTDMDVCNAS